MRCPYCGSMGSRVLDSRPAHEGKSIRRRRECETCERRFTTFEMVEEKPLMVIKKDGGREEFSREKVLRGLIRACEKRTVPLNQLKSWWTGLSANCGSRDGRRCHPGKSVKW